MLFSKIFYIYICLVIRKSEQEHSTSIKSTTLHKPEPKNKLLPSLSHAKRKLLMTPQSIIKPVMKRNNCTPRIAIALSQ